MSIPEKISPDDPQLTAYALGELEPAERTAFEERLQHDPAARAQADAIADAARYIGEALAGEPLPETIAPDFPTGAPAPQSSQRGRQLPGHPARRHGLGKLLQFPYLYYTISTSAAACFVVAFLLWKQGYDTRPNVEYTQVNLAEAPLPAIAGSAPSAVAGLASRGSGEEAGEFVAVNTAPISAFLPLVNTTSYAEVKKSLQAGSHPAKSLVQIEALVNHFDYPETGSGHGKETFAARLEVAAAPWYPTHRLVRINLQGRDQPTDQPLALLARDLNVQVAFNPALVHSYRLLGFERRVEPSGATLVQPLVAPEIHGGHAVTALYEIILSRAAPPAGESTGPTWAAQEKPVVALSEEMLKVNLRYRLPEGDQQLTAEYALHDDGRLFAHASKDFKFAASVVAFGLLLRDGLPKDSVTVSQVEEWARSGVGEDVDGQRREFVGLVKLARKLYPH